MNQLTDSEYFQLLSADRRRETLDVLAERTAPIELDALAAAVAAREKDVDTVTEEKVNQVSLTLHHVHLPKMADFGVVDYDSDACRVESCPSNRI
ncbi:DUF7344 domain-containing protein [Halomicrococcus sp. NG-SE-24]|uniref:DUF7344 domain-containing protein n=1 Tax=Halomicrococcus sp. NG-SE-24 TaxID=3436928 RepID=UPI003D9705A1